MNGRFVARCAAGLSFLPNPGTTVSFVPPQTDVARSARVASAEWIDDVRFEVVFEGLDDDESARALLGCHCLVERSVVPEESYGEDFCAWTGWKVEDDARGLSGTIESVVPNPGQALLEINLDGRERPLLVPLVDEFVLDVDEQARVVRVSVPAGLLEL